VLSGSALWHPVNSKFEQILMKKIALLLLAAIPVMGGEPLPKFGFADQLIAPVRIHLLQTPGELNLTTTLTEKDIHRILGKVNKIWAQVGIHFALESIVHEPATKPNVYRQNYRSRKLNWLLALRPEKTRSKDCFHLYYIKRFAVNGVYLAPDGMFVKDLARLRPVKDGLDEPIPRVTAHELGHALTLRHRQHVINLMQSGTTGWRLNAAEAKQTRKAAGQIDWIYKAPVLLKVADDFFKKGEKKKATKIYAQLATLPLGTKETKRARLRATTKHK